MSKFNDTAPGHVIFLIDRYQVENLQYDVVLEALLAMTASTESVRHFAGRIEVIFEGYSDDPRELYIIPEVCEYVACLTAAFPYWFHFGNKVDPSLFILVACLMKIESTRTIDGEVTATYPPGALMTVTAYLFSKMNGLYAQHGLTETERSKTTQEVGEYIRTFLP